MSRYTELVAAVIEENRKVLEAVSEKEIGQLIAEIEKAKCIQLFAMRLKHMGFNASH